MDRARYAKLRAVFRALEGVPPGERAARLEGLCGGDAALRAEALDLLERADGLDGFLEEPAAPRREPGHEPARLPERIGSHRVLALLGSGGMGVVYLAEQDRPRRRVALKVLRSPDDEPALRRRFAREVEALGRLEHPGIARVYSSGTTDEALGSRPYFTMELVEGAPLLEHARASALTIEERLRLFVEVCHAVQHAHEEGVLHRDLKPSNVLVDATGRPKVLDFGVARLIGETAGASFHTAPGTVLGTLAYMAPEQAVGEEKAPDPRSDVYSLGAVLYELLTGRVPIETARLLVPQALRAIAEDEPERAGKWDPRLRGDLETILARALEKDPCRRYASARELAEDLLRHLRHEPILARPVTVAYTARKLVRRHRGLAAGLALAFLALAGGLAAALAALAQAHASRRAFEAERRAVESYFDARELDDLRALADDLWPAEPATLPAIHRWLARARPMSAAASERRALLNELAGTAPAEAREGWLLEVQDELTAKLEAFVAPETGLLAEIEARARFAEELEARTVDAYRAEWDATIAGVRASPRYGGLELAPQIGLVPLGPDPESGLFEFALYGASGAVPARDPATGRLAFDASTAIMLVLVPGGAATVGAQRDDPLAPHYDPGLRGHEGPARAVPLEPFLVSKYETTQAQWTRCAGSNPSYWQDGDSIGVHRIESTQPVVNVSWEDATQVLARFGLELPTEAQWEHAARGGTDEPWWTGRSALSLWGAEHVGPFAKLTRAFWGLELPPAPLSVGRLRANPYGLHDVLGNAMEWCRDHYKVDYFARELAAGDGLVVCDPTDDRSLRGASWTNGVDVARCALRNDAVAVQRSPTVGVRAVRRLRPAAAAEEVALER